MRYHRKAVLFKLETTYGTDPTPAGASDGILARTLQVRPLKISYEKRQMIRPFFANDGQIVTGQWAEIELEVEMQGAGGAVDAVPKWSPMVRACAMAVTVNTSTSVQWDPISTGEESATIYFYIDGRLHKMLGCRGSKFGFRIRAGGVPVFMFAFIGLHVSPTDATLVVPTLTGFKKPLAANNSNTTPFTLHSYSGRFREFSFVTGLQSEYRNLIGSESVVINGRNPTGKITLESDLVATKDWWTIIKAETTGAMAFTHGTATGLKVSFSAPAVQITEPDETAESNTLMLSAGLEFQPTSAGNDEFRITST